jgi:hypothetical protein
MTWGCSCPQCGRDDCPNFGRCGGTITYRTGFFFGMYWHGWVFILTLVVMVLILKWWLTHG